MNPQKIFLIGVNLGKKVLSICLMGGILFSAVFINPSIVYAQDNLDLPQDSSSGPGESVLFDGEENNANAGLNSRGGNQYGPGGIILPSDPFLPTPNLDASGGNSQDPNFMGPQQSSATDPIGFQETSSGWSWIDANGVRQHIGAPGSGSQIGSLSGGSSTSPTTSTGGVVGGALQCSAAGVLGNILASSIRSAISNLIGGAIRSAVSSILSLTVPVDVKGPVAEHIVGDVQARTGSFTIGSIFRGVSWDSIAWCIVNSMIEQIANSTIAWANSGFNGNPAFIQNPERFFSDLADQTAGSIIRDIAYGGTGINVCQPFRVNIAVGLAQNYQSRQTPLRGLSCRLSDITQQRFFGGVTTSVGGSRVSTTNRPGNISWNDWIEVTQNDQSNPYGSHIVANQALYAGVSQRQNTVQFEVGLNNGWLNFKKCKDPKNPKSCDIVTPGRLIESQLNSTLDQSKNRLVMAQKFDQMITAIVNNLIKVALNKVLSN